LGKWVFNIVVKPLVFGLSYLPFPVLYGLSNTLFVIVYYMTGYRKNVVTTNLRNSFPEKSASEIKKITRDFYLHFCDVLVETIKLLTISKKEFRRRCKFDGAAIATFEEFFRRKQTIIGVMGHCGNWEWAAIAHQAYFERMITGVYHPLHNQSMDKFMLGLRSRWGGDIVAMTGLYKRLLTLKQQSIDTTIGLIADQTPPPESAYWTDFLNQDTPVFNGTEKLAKKFNYPVVFLNIQKSKRGFYDLSATVLAETPSSLPENQISELHVRHLEENIRQQPYTWLWSHRRWKHRRPANS
jgi:KDO2-lipid IV(A) lauroyltransferase